MRVTECCCGCSLRTGTIIIGYFHAIGAFIAMVALITVTYMLGKGTPPDFKKDEFLMVVFGICSVVALIQLFVSVSLIYGCYTGKRGFLLPWKIFSWISFIFMVVTVLLDFVRLVGTGDAIMLLYAAVQAISTALLWYFIVVVSSYGDSLVQQTGVVSVANEDPKIIINPVNNA